MSIQKRIDELKNQYKCATMELMCLRDEAKKLREKRRLTLHARKRIKREIERLEKRRKQ